MLNYSRNICYVYLIELAVERVNKHTLVAPQLLKDFPIGGILNILCSLFFIFNWGEVSLLQCNCLYFKNRMILCWELEPYQSAQGSLLTMLKGPYVGWGIKQRLTVYRACALTTRLSLCIMLPQHSPHEHVIVSLHRLLDSSSTNMPHPLFLVIVYHSFFNNLLDFILFSVSYTLVLCSLLTLNRFWPVKIAKTYQYLQN